MLNRKIAALSLALNSFGFVIPIAAQSPLFSGPNTITTLDFQPWSVAVGDFDSDGKRDLAVAGSTSFTAQSKIYTVHGKADGTFNTVASVSAGSGYPWISIGDFNKDGRDDIVSANHASKAVYVLTNDGLDSFGKPKFLTTSYALAAGPVYVAVYDVNGDGVSDIVTANVNADTISVLIGNANGTFMPEIITPVGAWTAPPGSFAPRSVAMGDLNGDTKLDLVVSYASVSNNSVAVLYGNGNGTFLSPIHYYEGGQGYAESIALADINKDGALDILCTTRSGAIDGVLVWLGNQNGTLQSASIFSVGGRDPMSLVVDDLNGDCNLDVAVATGGTPGSGPSTASVLLGSGNGTFAPVTNYDIGLGTWTSPRCIAKGQLNGDYMLDLVVPNLVPNTVAVLINQGPPGPCTPSPCPGTPVDPLTQGLVARWSMDPDSMSTPTKVLEIVAGNHAILANGAGVVANNPRGASLQLHGVNEYANVPYSSTLNLGVNNFTLAAWIRTTATVGALLDRREFVSGPQGVTMNGYLLELTGGRTRLWLNGWPFSSSVSINDGQWHHVAVTIDRSSSTGLRFYLDGNPTVDAAMNPLVTPLPLDNPVLLQVGGGFTGDLDEAAIFNRALTPAEVALLASVMSYGPSTPGCTAPSVIWATPAARVGSSFTVSANHGPANGMGWAMIGSVPVFEGTNYGLPEYPVFDVDILSLVTYPAFTTNACGNGSVSFAVPANPAYVGITVYAQTLWYTPGCFPNGPTGLELATSNGLAITILQ